LIASVRDSTSLGIAGSGQGVFCLPSATYLLLFRRPSNHADAGVTCKRIAGQVLEVKTGVTSSGVKHTTVLAPSIPLSRIFAAMVRCASPYIDDIRLASPSRSKASSCKNAEHFNQRIKYVQSARDRDGIL
jgi:hypothetical protein